jgi:hypothetical protein
MAVSQEGIDNIRLEKQQAFDKLYDQYRNQSFYHSFHEYGNSNNGLKLQENQLKKDRNKLVNIQSDLDTLRQQLLLSNNEYYLRSNQIQILKTVFIFLVLTLGNIIIHKSNFITTFNLYIIQLVLTIIFGIILLNQALWNKKRMTNDFRVFNWDISSETSSEEIKPEEEVLKCIPKPSKVQGETNKTKINIII